jgi:hypothetical protein
LIEIQDHVSQFQTFLHSISTSTLWKAPKDRPRQAILFKSGGFIQQTLSTSLEDLNKSGVGLGFESCHGYAVAIYLSLALLSFADCPDESERYLLQLQLTFIENSLDLRPNIHLMFFIFLQREGKMSLDSVERAWATIRLMQVLKRLSWIRALSIGHSLLEFLMLVEPGNTNRYEDEVSADMVFEEVMPGVEMLQSRLSKH